MSWINWYAGITDYNYLLRRIFEEDRILSETWNRQHTSKEEAMYIPADYDESFDDPGSPILLSPFNQQVTEILNHKRSTNKGRPQQKLRIPVPKRVKVQLVRERGGLCESCRDHVFQQIHHIDRNPSNNNPVNLLLVCYDCHLELERK